MMRPEVFEIPLGKRLDGAPRPTGMNTASDDALRRNEITRRRAVVCVTWNKTGA